MKAIITYCLLLFCSSSFCQSAPQDFKIGEHQQHIRDSFAYYQQLYKQSTSKGGKDSIEQVFTKWFISKSKSSNHRFDGFYGKVVSIHYSKQDTVKYGGEIHLLPVYGSIVIQGMDGLEYLYYQQAESPELLKQTAFYQLAQSISTRSYNFRKNKKEFYVQFDAIGTFSEDPRVIGLKGTPGYQLRVIEVECNLVKIKLLNFETDMHFKEKIEANDLGM